MMGLIKLIFAVVLIVLVGAGTVLGGFIGFIVTLLVAVVFSSMFSRIEKNKLESKRHDEMLKVLEKNKQN